MVAHEIIGLGALVIVVAGISAAIYRGGQTAQVLQASANGFAQVVRAATLSS